MKHLTTKFNLFRPLLAALILFIPLYPKFPLTNVSFSYVAIRLDDIVVTITIFAWIIYQLKNGFPIIQKRITGLFLAYFAAIIASTVAAVFIHQTDPTTTLLVHLLRRFEYMSLFFITITAVNDLKETKYPFIFLCLTTFFVCLYGYGQKYLSLPVISTMNEEFSKGYLLTLTTWTRINSTFAGHYDLASYLSVVLVVLGGVTLTLKQHWLLKLPLIGLWLMSFDLLTLTASRISIFAFWGGMVLTLFLIRKKIWIIPVSILVVISIGNSVELKQRLMATVNLITPISLPSSTPISLNNPTVTPVPIISPVVIPTTKTPKPTPLPTVIRHQTTESYPPVDADVGVARSGEIRFKVEWPRAITAFSKNVLVGTGLGSITLATDNDYLRLLGESGLLGFLSFLAIFAWFIWQTLPHLFSPTHSKSHQIQIILLGALVTTLANAIFIDVFEASKTAYLFWIMMGIYYQATSIPDKNDE